MTGKRANQTNRERGAFIVVEGLDGAGTTTQVHALSSHLRGLGFKTLPTREPSGGPVGQVLRAAIEGREQFTPEALALGFAADRLHHMGRPGGINDSLADGVMVISDRYILSALAYQAAQGVDFDWLVELNRYAPTPDVTIFIDTPLNTCLARIQERNSNLGDIFHKRSALINTRRQYLKALQQESLVGNLVASDGRGSKEQVLTEVLSGVVAALHDKLGLLANLSPAQVMGADDAAEFVGRTHNIPGGLTQNTSP